MLTHGSDERLYVGSPPAHSLKAGYVLVQRPPPVVEYAVSNPWAPPSDQRSCWKTPITFEVFVGLTATKGSTSALGKLIPPESAPNVQVANGSTTDARD